MDTNLKKIVYQTQGTCTSQVTLLVEGETVREVLFEGGCDGNLQAICRLIAGMKARDVIQRLDGIDCGGRGTSCPDQLAQALRSTLPRND
jgi:uncharacterized protein (TIGR03905 family)